MGLGICFQNFRKSVLVARDFCACWRHIKLEKSCGYTLKKSIFLKKILRAPNVPKRLFGAYGDVLRASRPLELIFRKIVKIPKLDDLDSFWAKTENGQNRGFVTTRTRRMFALWSWKFICRAYSPSATRCLNQIEKRLISVVFMSLSKSRFWGFKVIAHKNIPNNNRSVWGS